MKTIKLLAIITLFMGVISCNKKDDDTPTQVNNLVTSTMKNLNAPQKGGQGQPVSGAFTKFNFATGKITTNDKDWDIAFRGTSIIINGGTSSGVTDEPDRNGQGGAYITSGTLDDVTEANTSMISQDSAEGYAIKTGSGNGWYNYTGSPDHLILPITGKILVIKTHDGKYAKLEILSYYKDAPAKPNVITGTDKSEYYTFNYVYQPNEGVSSFK